MKARVIPARRLLWLVSLAGIGAATALFLGAAFSQVARISMFFAITLGFVLAVDLSLSRRWWQQANVRSE